MFPNFSYEKPFWNQRYTVVGLDEVGRGALAGPVYVCAFAAHPAPTDTSAQELLSLKINDSKKLTKTKRQYLHDILTASHAIQYAVGVSDVDTINHLGIVTALENAALQALSKIHKKLDQKNIHLLIDGNKSNCIKNTKLPQLPIIKGDSLSISIAAASIIAKVKRDEYMTKISQHFKHYKWDINKGYGTRDHIAALKTHGKTNHHRNLYLRKLALPLS